MRRLFVGRSVGELRYGKDVDQIEEQLQRRDPLLPSVPGSQHTSVIGIVHHLPPVSIVADPSVWVRDHALVLPPICPQTDVASSP